MDSAGQPHSNPPPFLAFVSRLVAFFLLLLAAKNAYYGTSLVLTAALSCLVLALSVDIRAHRQGRPQPIPIPAILALLWLILSYAVYAGDSSRLVWAFPSIVGVFFITRRRNAIGFSVMTLLSMTCISLFQGDTGIALRFAAALGFSILFLDLATSQINALQKRIVEASHRDPLTNCFNRRQLEVTAEEIQPKQSAALVLIDVDHFKLINDTQGHVAGDRVLVLIADILRQQLNPEDLLFRIGGEEFALILPNSDTEAGARLAERLRDAVSDTKFPVQGRITISIGVTAFDTAQPLPRLLERADKLLYQAKRGGRNQVCADGPGATAERNLEPAE